MLALTLLGLVVAGILQFPILQGWLTLGLLLLTTLSFYRPALWLFALPALLPIANSAPWSGRFFLTEFDFLALTCIAIALFHGQYRRTSSRLKHVAIAAMLLLMASHLISLVIGSLPVQAIDSNSFFSYYSHYNALRIETGFLYALLLYMPARYLYQAAPEYSVQLVTRGILTGVFLVGLIVLWERGTFTDMLYAQNRYEFFRSLLNFSTPYRITALFSEMHSGGTAIDGYLILCWPITLWCTLAARTRLLQTIGFLGFLACSYATLVTFSRGVVFGVLVAMLIIVIGYLLTYRIRIFRWRALGILLSGLLLTGTLIVAYRSGGTLAIFGLAALTLSCYLAGYRPFPPLDRFRWHALVPTVLFLAWFIFHAQTTSKWHPQDAGSALLVTLGVCSIAGIAAFILGIRAQALPGRRTALLIGTGFILFATMMTFGVGGYRMTERLSGVSADLAHRTEHWNTALRIMDHDLVTGLFGMGAGRFPEAYLFRANAPQYGSYLFLPDPATGKPLLELGGGKDARIGQRIQLAREHRHRLTVVARTDDPKAMLYVRICRRHLINPNEWNPSCYTLKEEIERSAPGVWNTIEKEIPANFFKTARPIGQPPLTLTVSNRREYAYALRPPTLLQVSAVELLDLDTGKAIIHNADFSAGGDRWFPYFDFNHLPWHIKNVWLSIYFDAGLLGIFATLVAIVAVVRTSLREATAHQHLPLYLTASILGFFAVGSFGTLLDTPRIAYLFYSLLFMSWLLRRPDPTG